PREQRSANSTAYWATIDFRSEQRREEFVQEYHEVATLVEPEEELQVIDADSDDDVFLECAVEADADYIISGDTHLTDLGSFRGIEILRPAEFLERLANDA
ncbi:MAG: putative toxin-antitoxin system toxin component, PIN family, partial [Euryarchaeota archaeon]|nr:putative toxin-antitoxin system toxin component, PIN family [Euryarchaeota archaeon]